MEVHHPHHPTHKKKWSEYIIEFVMLFAAVTLGLTEKQVTRFHDVAIREGNRAVALRIFKGSFATTKIKGQISQVQTPTLILWGEKDNLISVKMQTNLSEISRVV